MLKDLFAKKHVADKWPEVQAIVRIVNQYEEPVEYDFPLKFAEGTFAFTDAQGEHQYGTLQVADSSSLYDAKEDDTFSILINPANPDQYDFPEAIRPRF